MRRYCDLRWRELIIRLPPTRWAVAVMIPHAVNFGLGRFGFGLSRATCQVPGRRWRPWFTSDRQR